MELFFAILFFTIATMVTPGPNNIMVMTSSLNYGIKRTMPHYLGICFGFPAMVFVIGLGFGTLFTEFPLLHQIIQIVGVVFLLYISWKIATTETDLKKQKSSKPFSFLQAAMFQWVNPKAWVMAISAVSAYTSVGGNLTYEILIICLTFFLVGFPCIGIWMVFGKALKHLLKSPRHQKIFNIGMGTLLAASIVLILFD